MSIPALIAQLAAHNLRLHIWPNGAGHQVNVSSHGEGSWTVAINLDLDKALTQALEQRIAAHARTPSPPRAAPPAAAHIDDDEDLIG